MMTIQKSHWLLLCAVILGTVTAALQLGWEHTRGGILRHHLLNDASLPAISNLWALLVMPMLGALAGWEHANGRGYSFRRLPASSARCLEESRYRWPS